MDLAKSFMAQVTLALRTPLLAMDQTEEYTKGRKNPKHITVHKTASLPAWFALGAAVTALLWARSQQPSAPGFNLGPIHFNL